MAKTTLVLLGANGVGKGTQAQKLAQYLKVPQISTGDILRAEIQAKSELGLRAKEIMDRGELVSDDIMIGIVKNRLLQDDAVRGAIFDGFPRTITQAETLDKLLEELRIPVSSVVNIEVPDNDIVERLTSRRVCTTCGAVFNFKLNPQDIENHQCPKGVKNIIQREDDKAETVTKRLQIYQQNTAPLINYYKKTEKLRSVYGVGSTQEVFARIVIAMDSALS